MDGTRRTTGSTFSNIEDKNFINKTMVRIEQANETNLTKQDAIFKELNHFYEKIPTR